MALCQDIVLLFRRIGVPILGPRHGLVPITLTGLMFVAFLFLFVEPRIKVFFAHLNFASQVQDGLVDRCDQVVQAPYLLQQRNLMLFLAFIQPVGIGALVAGYAVGDLFRIVSITPQGIGFVEGMMTLTFTSLSIPGEVAATVALVFRGLTFWLPLLLRFFAVLRMRTVGKDQRILT